MSGVFRTSPFVCPTCASPLREFQHRLVCDACSGMLIDLDDLATSIQELDGSTDAPVLADATPDRATCPRCEQPMQSCAVSIGSLNVGGRLLSCARDGVWVSRDAMVALFARVSRRGGFRGLGAVHHGGDAGGSAAGLSGSDTASFVANMPSVHSGMSAAIGSIASAFSAGAPATAGLAISSWRAPHVHTLLVSAYRDHHLACPACGDRALAYVGSRWACEACRGSFVEYAALAAMITEITFEPWDPPPMSGAPGERRCPICSEAMHVDAIEATAIERCGDHGVWFADHHLEEALQHASSAPHHAAGAPTHGIVGWLRRLFSAR